MSLAELTHAGLEQAINRYLSLDPANREALSRLHGRVIAFELLGLGRTIYLVPDPAGIQVLGEYEGEPDCLLRGTPLGLARLGRREGGQGELFSGAVEVSGDTELAHSFGKIIGAIDIDWEEQLSHLTGDLIAHEVGNAARAALRWGRDAAETMRLDVGEYLQEELRLLPVRLEVEEFLEEVDTLRDDVERLQARIAVLRGSLTGKAPAAAGEGAP